MMNNEPDISLTNFQIISSPTTLPCPKCNCLCVVCVFCTPNPTLIVSFSLLCWNWENTKPLAAVLSPWVRGTGQAKRVVFLKPWQPRWLMQVWDRTGREQRSFSKVIYCRLQSRSKGSTKGQRDSAKLHFLSMKSSSIPEKSKQVMKQVATPISTV